MLQLFCRCVVLLLTVTILFLCVLLPLGVSVEYEGVAKEALMKSPRSEDYEAWRLLVIKRRTPEWLIEGAAWTASMTFAVWALSKSYRKLKRNGGNMI